MLFKMTEIVQFFDELGRGTATYDGMSLAKQSSNIFMIIKCKTFSTHYHELVVLHLL